MTAHQIYEISKVVDWIFKTAVPAGLVLIWNLTASVQEIDKKTTRLDERVIHLQREQEDVQRKLDRYDANIERFYQTYELTPRQ